jgi:coenzyme PQQ precursor peptide PqqA
MSADSSDAGSRGNEWRDRYRMIRQRAGHTRKVRSKLLEKPMWSKPEYTEMRFGFEVTMYIANR